jgi:hypothetical protein
MEISINQYSDMADCFEHCSTGSFSKGGTPESCKLLVIFDGEANGFGVPQFQETSRVGIDLGLNSILRQNSWG